MMELSPPQIPEDLKVSPVKPSLVVKLADSHEELASAPSPAFTFERPVESIAPSPAVSVPIVPFEEREPVPSPIDSLESSWDDKPAVPSTKEKKIVDMVKPREEKATAVPQVSMPASALTNEEPKGEVVDDVWADDEWGSDASAPAPEVGKKTDLAELSSHPVDSWGFDSVPSVISSSSAIGAPSAFEDDDWGAPLTTTATLAKVAPSPPKSELSAETSGTIFPVLLASLHSCIYFLFR